MSWQTYVDDHLMCEIDGQHLTAAAILGHDGSVWAVSASFPQVSAPFTLCVSRIAISIYTVRYGRYVSVRQVIVMWTACYQVVPPKSNVDGRFGCRRSIEGEIDLRRSIVREKGKKKKKKEVPRRPRLRAVVAMGDFSPA
ncbi:hypothetical protein BHE74_00006686 [Ensete ventricosum]|nr:hypothetical protein BHE74_00006686 [Ensete ventricosum]